MKLGYYQHYKGAVYLVEAIARHSETLEPLVIYARIHTPAEKWARPQSMFYEFVTMEGGERTPRFTFLGESCQLMAEP